ncbi:MULTISPECIES: DUF3263 domain-containing protein [unclassified Pseudoclavibacter]|uniref:DUF3263 domain-containing protein n=1 Tax=unclassified Pseudoclavibacter TaxID=2615177 RepID=UPI0012F10AC8|nr:MULTISPECIES: DUF3263 domain-containing protein [unclassified Pseudoclavibacter]MBF4460841.1 DUF3263 domain-containing protein [Pseudoclavibacter sp. VKM Ac-2867]VXB78949.1 conserved hypothetical protein [Pseudoclavibacter sp. 8L]
MERDVELSDLERALLDFEDLNPRQNAAKAAAIRDRFGWSTTQYYRNLATLIETPAALAHQPMLVGRLRRARERRADERQLRREQRMSSASPTSGRIR